MFRIRRLYDTTLPVNYTAIQQVQKILRFRFPAIPAKDIAKIPEQLQNPLKYRFRTVLLVADDFRGDVRGFALLCHAPDLNFCFLDFIATRVQTMGRGLGGALYERVRRESLHLKAVGLFFECLPDDPALCRDSSILNENTARLRFYERYGARPIIDTKYETPIKPGGDNPPYLVLDDLGQGVLPSLDAARAIVRAILERKYGAVCPAGYIDMVVNSLTDDPVRLRPPRYSKAPPLHVQTNIPDDKKIDLIVNDHHGIHHIKERGYVESPVRIRSILDEIDKTGLFYRLASGHFPERHILAVHDHQFVQYFKKVCSTLEPGTSVYPYVFPVRNVARPPKELAIRAGYYCIDTFTPLNRDACTAATGSVDCALTGAERILTGSRLVYALVRPPGHHAERRAFGGFCYFNSAAIAAHYLSSFGKVAMLDIDYHHGNGSQDIFYGRSDVLTISIHGHPQIAFPYFSGFREESGSGEAEGCNINIPLSETISSDQYKNALADALKKIMRFKPKFLVVSLGFDTARGDPTGTWDLRAKDFEINGTMIGMLRLPTLLVQEGGYNTRTLGVNARHFFKGIWHGMYENR